MPPKSYTETAQALRNFVNCTETAHNIRCAYKGIYARSPDFRLSQDECYACRLVREFDEVGSCNHDIVKKMWACPGCHQVFDKIPDRNDNSGG